MTYLYETVPALEGDEVVLYEIEQKMSDLPLSQHPETGEFVRRVILGGWGNDMNKSDTSCCGPEGCC